MIQYSIQDLITDKMSGEWGAEACSDNCVKVLRTTNFTNEGKLNLKSVVSREVEQKKIAKKKLKYGDVIIEKSGGSPKQPVGRVVFFDVDDGDDYLCNNFTSILRPSDKVEPKYFFYSLFFLHRSGRTLNYQNKTTGIINLQLDRYLKIEKIPLPPLETQKRIVARLDAADQLRCKRKQAIALLDDYLKAVFLEMFGDPHHNIHNLPVGVIGDLVDEVKYGTSKKAEVGGEYPYLRMNNITYSGELNIYDLKYINLTEGEKPKYLAQRGDVLFNRTNSKELVGKTTVYDLDEPMAIAGYLIRVRVNDKAIPEYIAGYLNSKHGKLTLESMCKNIVGMANINAKELQKISINIPPLRLQKDYADVVRRTRALKTKMAIQVQELDVNFNALMQGAFNPN